MYNKFELWGDTELENVLQMSYESIQHGDPQLEEEIEEELLDRTRIDQAVRTHKDIAVEDYGTAPFPGFAEPEDLISDEIDTSQEKRKDAVPVT